MSKQKVIIVGAGMGGLTAAAYLTKENYEVLVIDMMERIGGLVSTFEREGYYFDSGPRAFVNSGMVKPILRDLGIEWEELDNRITMCIEEEMVEISSLDSIIDYEVMLKKLYPERNEEITKISKVIQKLSKHTEVLYEFDNPNFVDYFSDKKVLFKEFLPWLFKLFLALRVFNKYEMPAEDFLKKITSDSSLIDILLQFFFAKTPAYFALGYFQVYLDYFYLKGGTGSLPKLVYEKVIGNNGQFQMNTRIDKILPKENKILDSKGQSYTYDYLIWAADLKTLYKNIDTNFIEDKHQKEYNNQHKNVMEGKTAESVFVTYLGVNMPPSFFKERGGEHLFFTPSTKGLGDVVNAEKERLIRSDFTEDDLVHWVHDFCDYNTFEVSIPALRDSSLAPDGKTGVMISCLMDYDVVNTVKRRGLLNLFKKTMEERIVQVFSKSFYPRLSSKIEFQFSSNPLTLESVSGNTSGSIVGWSFEGKAPVTNKLTKLSKTVNTPIPNIFKASQWAYAPAGVPIAMLTGWQATRKIISAK